jgi:RHS repeat-associated protein
VSNDTTGHGTTWGWETTGDGNGDLAYCHNGGPWNHFAADTAFELITDRSAVGNPYLFTGRRYDPEKGWYYYRTRYLDPRVGRFTTRDAFGLWGDPFNLGNGLTYVGSNPFTMLDPLGWYTVSSSANAQYTPKTGTTTSSRGGKRGLPAPADDSKGGDLLIAVWLAGEAVDDASREHVVDLQVPGVRCSAACAIDTLNGTLHELRLAAGPEACGTSGAADLPLEEGAGTGVAMPTLRGICVRDWPLIVTLRGER